MSPVPPFKELPEHPLDLVKLSLPLDQLKPLQDALYRLCVEAFFGPTHHFLFRDQSRVKALLHNEQGVSPSLFCRTRSQITDPSEAVIWCEVLCSDDEIPIAMEYTFGQLLCGSIVIPRDEDPFGNWKDFCGTFDKLFTTFGNFQAGMYKNRHCEWYDVHTHTIVNTGEVPVTKSINSPPSIGEYYTEDEKDEHGNPAFFSKFLSDPDYRELVYIFRHGYDATYDDQYNKCCNLEDSQYSAEQASFLAAKAATKAGAAFVARRLGNRTFVDQELFVSFKHVGIAAVEAAVEAEFGTVRPMLADTIHPMVVLKILKALVTATQLPSFLGENLSGNTPYCAEVAAKIKFLRSEGVTGETDIVTDDGTLLKRVDLSGFEDDDMFPWGVSYKELVFVVEGLEGDVVLLCLVIYTAVFRPPRNGIFTDWWVKTQLVGQVVAPIGTCKAKIVWNRIKESADMFNVVVLACKEAFSEVVDEDLLPGLPLFRPSRKGKRDSQDSQETKTSQDSQETKTPSPATAKKLARQHKKSQKETQKLRQQLFKAESEKIDLEKKAEVADTKAEAALEAKDQYKKTNDDVIGVLQKQQNMSEIQNNRHYELMTKQNERHHELTKTQNERHHELLTKQQQEAERQNQRYHELSMAKPSEQEAPPSESEQASRPPVASRKKAGAKKSAKKAPKTADDRVIYFVGDRVSLNSRPSQTGTVSGVVGKGWKYEIHWDGTDPDQTETKTCQTISLISRASGH